NRGIRVTSGMFGTIGEDYSTLESIRATGGLGPDPHWEGNRAIAAETARKAKNMGLKLVSFHAGFIPHDAKDPEAIKLMARIVEVARLFAEQGVGLLFETGQEDGPTLAATMKDLHRRGATNLGVNFDPANMILYDMGDPIAALRSLMPYVKQVHIKDARRTKVKGTWGEEVVVGTGEVDWPAFVRVLAEHDYAGACMIEREAGDHRLDDIAAAAKHLTAVIAKARS
ncbi:MAG: sugar phosphate isomerase/epimerase, partial [Phycisphaeraceae bacterium]|nr:sugar phosphate isomerase/epimerase [Phycisphaeraceae bacterium]